MTNKTFKYLLILAMFSNFMVAEETTKPEEENKAKENQNDVEIVGSLATLALVSLALGRLATLEN